MASEHMRKFDADLVPRDHAEANLINKLVDEGLPVSEAITEVENDLSDSTSKLAAENPELVLVLGQKFGYETAKRASTWWNYRNAYLMDRKEVFGALDHDADGDPWQFGLEPEFASYEDKLDLLIEEQQAAGAAMVAGDDFYTRLFAELETERVKAIRNHQDTWFIDPLANEHNMALKGLLNIMDEVLQNGLSGDESRAYKGKIKEDGKTNEFLLTQTQEEDVKVYGLDIFAALENLEARGNNLPIANYTFVETPEGSIQSMGMSLYGPVLIDTLAVTGFARAFHAENSSEPTFER